MCFWMLLLLRNINHIPILQYVIPMYTMKCTLQGPISNLLRPSDVKYALVNQAIIGSDNGLSPSQRQAIIWIIVKILLIRNKLQWNLKRNLYNLIQENAFENVVCEMASILSRPKSVNMD